MYIELQNAVKKYKSENVETLALNGMSLGIEKGEMIAVAGPSGSGKTTLLNIIGGMDRLTKGKYLFQGEDTGTYNDRQLNTYRKENVGFIFQSFELMNRYNVYENIEMPLLVRNVKNRKKQIEDYMEKLHIADLAKKYPSQLSDGQKQRAAIARALVYEPDIILGDEPTGALDSETAAGIFGILKKIQEDGKTIIIVTHDPVIAGKCERTIHIVDGKNTCPDGEMGIRARHRHVPEQYCGDSQSGR